MKKFNSVLAFGDSHVAGCELAGHGGLDDYINGNLTLEELDAPGKELAFPKIVADRLGVPCYNYSMSGGSNDRSLRLLVNAVQEHPNSLVLFGYTCTDRTEFFYPDEGNFLGRDQNSFIQVGLQWEGKVKGKMTHPINDLFIEKFLRPHSNLKELMFIVDNICTMWATEFLHLPLFPEELPEADNVFTFEGLGNYLDWCKEKKFNQLPFYHYDIKAHEKLAELILKEIL